MMAYKRFTRGWWIEQEIAERLNKLATMTKVYDKTTAHYNKRKKLEESNIRELEERLGWEKDAD